jgi:hypothetical protein
MGSSSKKRQTFAKMTRERAVKERRALKQEKKEARKAAAAAEAAGTAFPAEAIEGDESTEPATHLEEPVTHLEEGRESA